MNKIKKNDVVYVLSGRDKGKTGKVFEVVAAKGKALVEGINNVKKHVRKTKNEQQGGVIHKESAIQLSKLALFCKTCSKPAKIGFNALTDGTKTRYCKKCKEVI